MLQTLKFDQCEINMLVFGPAVIAMVSVFWMNAVGTLIHSNGYGIPEIEIDFSCEANVWLKKRNGSVAIKMQMLLEIWNFVFIFELLIVMVQIYLFFKGQFVNFV